jgi:hypothetical protein
MVSNLNKVTSATKQQAFQSIRAAAHKHTKTSNYSFNQVNKAKGLVLHNTLATKVQSRMRAAYNELLLFNPESKYTYPDQ